MTPQNFEEASQIFLEASRLPPPEQAAFVELRCGKNSHVGEIVAFLLRGQEQSQPPTQDVGQAAASAMRRAIADTAVGESVGNYVVLSKLGEGGFGSVWLAERRTPFVQRVALKIVKPGMDSAAVVARFEQERQSLAVMDHPNIARVMDGGITQAGRPYFVMEYVDGSAITDYCERFNLNLRARLELFARVCEAVQHAHTKGIIHRDLKPSNILVEESDGKPVPKVIDFGVAKAIENVKSSGQALTEHGVMLGTPEYMSPEQAGGERDVDTRSDVYSLGVVLYELLVGVPPFDGRELRSRGIEEILRIIREQEPLKPSERASRLSQNTPAPGIASGPNGPRFLSRTLRRELEWIPLKALRKDRERRYRSPEAMAKDIGRYLRGEALEAGPESNAYRVKAYVRRHRGGVAAVAAIGVSIVAGLVGTTRMAALADAAEREQRRLAESERSRREEAESLAKVLRDIVSQVRLQPPAVVVELTNVIRSASERAKVTMSSSDAAASRLASMIGELYFNLSDFSQARQELAPAVVRAEKAWGKDSLEAILARSALAICDTQTGADPNAIQVAGNELLTLRGRELEDAKPLWEMLTSTAALASDRALAEDLLMFADQLMDAKNEPHPSIDRALVRFVRGMGLADPKAGLEEMTAALSMGEQSTTPLDPSLLDMRGAIRMRMQSSGDSRGAIAFSEETVNRIRAVSSSPTRLLADEIKEQGVIARGMGNLELSLEKGREAVVLYRKCGVLCDAATSLSAFDLVGFSLNRLGRWLESTENYAEALDILSKCPTPNTTAIYFFRYNRAVALSHLDRFEEAIGDVEEALKTTATFTDGKREPKTRECEEALARLRSRSAI